MLLLSHLPNNRASICIQLSQSHGRMWERRIIAVCRTAEDELPEQDSVISMI
jgi:hypothetical protein